MGVAFLRNYSHDVFVSYSMTNDALTLDGQPWVRKLVEELTVRLQNLLPENGKTVEVYFAGKGSLRYGDQLKSCLDEAKKSAIFLIVGSPRYLDIWPASELQAFASTGERAPRERLFIAEMLPLAKGQAYPDMIGDPLRAEFWRPTPKTAARPFRQIDELCDTVLTELATVMAERLCELHALDQPVAGQRPANPDHKTVLLARVSEDLEPLNQKLRTHLEQYQIKVLPPSDFQEEGDRFPEEFDRYLEEADIVVQLLGANPGRRTRAMPNGYDGFQAERTRARADRVLMQWRPLTVDADEMTDRAHKALLSTATAMDFEPYKDMVVRLATAPTPAPTADRKGSSYILIDADEMDGETARQILRECRKRKVVAVLADPAANKRERRTTYGASEKIAVIHEKSLPRWVNSHLLGYVHLPTERQAQGKCVVYLGPPPPKDQEEITVVHPDFEFVEAPNGDLSKLFSKIF
jgi:hypothetical protein